jgi:signal transduction histidine kinase
MLDPARFDRVLQNLLSNAFKFSKPGQLIEVRVARVERSALISVRDYGIGIPAGELTKITTPFYRASTASGVPGTGLGLAGVKAIVEQHGGSLHIASTEGEGTTVTIRIPT